MQRALQENGKSFAVPIESIRNSSVPTDGARNHLVEDQESQFGMALREELSDFSEVLHVFMVV